MTNRYTSNEVEILKSIYPFADKDEILRKLSRTWVSVQCKASKMGIKRERREGYRRDDMYTDEEIKKLKKLYPTEEKEKILGEINRSWACIIYKARQLGLNRDKKFRALHMRSLDGRRRFSNIRRKKIEKTNYILDKDFLNWFLGFLEGEGTFIMCVSKTKSGLKYTILPAFHIHLHPSDTPVLSEIQCELKKVGIYAVLSNVDRTKLKENGKCFSSRIVKLSVYRHNSCLKLVEILSPLKWRTKKVEAFDVWKDMLLDINKGHFLIKEGFLKLMRKRDNLNKRHINSGRRRYDYEYFKNLWDVVDEKPSMDTVKIVNEELRGNKK